MFVPPYIFISRTLQFCFWRRAGTFYISAPCKAHSSDLQFLPTCGANAAMLLLCLWVAALKMKVCLNWGARATTLIQRHVHLHSCYPQTKNVPPRLQKQNCTNCALHSARTVHAQCTVQCMPQCTATKRCKYHGIGVLLTIYKKL